MFVRSSGTGSSRRSARRETLDWTLLSTDGAVKPRRRTFASIVGTDHSSAPDTGRGSVGSVLSFLAIEVDQKRIEGLPCKARSHTGGAGSRAECLRADGYRSRDRHAQSGLISRLKSASTDRRLRTRGRVAADPPCSPAYCRATRSPTESKVRDLRSFERGADRLARTAEECGTRSGSTRKRGPANDVQTAGLRISRHADLLV